MGRAINKTVTIAEIIKVREMFTNLEEVINDAIREAKGCDRKEDT